jgi:monoamine oxidase
VDEVVRQLELVHGVAVPSPTGAAYMNWARDPFGGAFHTWNVGVEAADVEAEMLRPDPATPLYICGDAYSSDQGWTEGALATAERVMERHLGLAPPPWLQQPV